MANSKVFKRPFLELKLFILTLYVTFTGWSQQKDTLIEIWKGSTLGVLYQQEKPKHKLVIENGVVYRDGLFRKNLGSADSLLQLIRHSERLENLHENDSIDCNIYERSIFIRYSFEKADRSLQTNTYFFSYSIQCTSEEREAFLRKIDAAIHKYWR